LQGIVLGCKEKKKKSNKEKRRKGTELKIENEENTRFKPQEIALKKLSSNKARVLMLRLALCSFGFVFTEKPKIQSILRDECEVH
jgi:hypothetical protein